MKIRSILGALVIAALPFTSVWAENMTPEDIKKLVDEAVNKRMQEHERREGATERGEGAAAPTAISEPDRSHAGIRRRIFARRNSAPCPSVQPDQVDWSTPSRSCSAPKAIVGGYFDIQYRSHRMACRSRLWHRSDQ